MTDVSVGVILEQAIGIEPARWTQKGQNRVSAYLKKKNWIRRQRRSSAQCGKRKWR